MQFNRVRVMVDVSLTSKTGATIFEHEVPILQVIRGAAKVHMMEELGPAEGDYDLESEWQRLMDKAKTVQVSEGNSMPAPLVAFPRGVRDLEDFYSRLRKPHDAKKPKPEVKTEEPASVGPKMPSAKEQRAAAKKRLDDLGIEYRGNASTESLLEILNEVDNADVQNEG